LRIDLTVRDGITSPLSGAALARAIEVAARAAGAPFPASIGLILTDDAELARLNAAHLGTAAPTDVLSFPLMPPEAFPAQPGAGAARRAPAPRSQDPVAVFALPPGRRPHLGDIVVSVQRAASQAQAGQGGQTGDVRWSPADELRLLVTHGTLHLCGWDHAEPAEEASMRALENHLLES
jgi:probable rRNA maturation factor